MVIDAAFWPSVLLALVAFGLLPGPLLRLIVRIYPKTDPRRKELVAELYGIEHHKQLLFVAQNLELAVFEGLPARWRSRHNGTTNQSLTPTGDVWARHGEDGYRGPQVCRVVGITYVQLDYFMRTGLVRPSIVGAGESGLEPRYSYTDLLELKLIKHLLDAGVALQSVRKAIEYLRKQGGDLATAKQALTATGPVLCRSDDEVSRQSGVLAIVALGRIKDKVDAGILGLRPPQARGQQPRPPS